MRLTLHIGPDHTSALALQRALAARRADLARDGVLYPRSPGNLGHVRLAMAAAGPGVLAGLRRDRGVTSRQAQQALRARVLEGLAQEIAAARPAHVILSAAHLGSAFHRASDIAALRDMLCGLTAEPRILITARLPGAQLLAHYAWQIAEGRTAPLARDLALLDRPDWWRACLDAGLSGPEGEAEAPPFWLDYAALFRAWAGVFGQGAVDMATLRDAGQPSGDIARWLGIDLPMSMPAQKGLSAATLTRARHLNRHLARLAALRGQPIPRRLRAGMIADIAVDGPPPDFAALASVTQRFRTDCAALARQHPQFAAPDCVPPPHPPWREADPGPGFRASQYLLAFMPRIERALRRVDPAVDEAVPATARALMTAPPIARQARRMAGTAFAPLAIAAGAGASDTPFTPIRCAERDAAGAVIVACVKDEAPYLPEWIAHHRAIGVGRFVIYSNDCSDGTAEMLARLSGLGLVEHRPNDDWQGKSPQQWALARAMRDPVVQGARWIAHIDADEFINIRTGNGTLCDLFAAVPDASHIAMTWRLFGSNGIGDIGARLVTETLDRCAPAHCPKPHTAWGFKTLFRNTGAYGKLACHRPTKPVAHLRDGVRWVNGSGVDITHRVAEAGWRSSRATIGYDLVQLNHYPLRGADGFLVKRGRGRALHVDQTIGLAYWLRNDWNRHRERSIQRNLPRMTAERAAMMADGPLRDLHARALDWHRARASAIRARPDGAALAHDIAALELDDLHRAAACVVMDRQPVAPGP